MASEAVLAALPHRPPFLFVDEIVERDAAGPGDPRRARPEAIVIVIVGIDLFATVRDLGCPRPPLAQREHG